MPGVQVRAPLVVIAGAVGEGSVAVGSVHRYLVELAASNSTGN